MQHFVVSDLHKGVKIFAFFGGSRAGLIELQNTKLEKKENGMKKKTAAYGSKDYETEMVFCYKNCSDLLWEKIVLVIEFWDH